MKYDCMRYNIRTILKSYSKFSIHSKIRIAWYNKMKISAFVDIDIRRRGAALQSEQPHKSRPKEQKCGSGFAGEYHYAASRIKCWIKNGSVVYIDDSNVQAFTLRQQRQLLNCTEKTMPAFRFVFRLCRGRNRHLFVFDQIVPCFFFFGCCNRNG